MAVVINTNVDSLKIQNILSGATNKMSASMQRMSTGLKINSAKDDAAGSVISARMQVQLNGNKIAQNNVQNGNAMLSTAEGNLDVVLDNVSRIRDLTLQAKNGTYSKEEISAMQDEVAERIDEIDRISKSSKYSQLELFNDSNLQTKGVTFQVGPNATADDVIKATADIFKSVEFDKITGFTTTNESEGAVSTDAPDAASGFKYVEISKSEYDQMKLGDKAADALHYRTYSDAAGTKGKEAGDIYLKKIAASEEGTEYSKPASGVGSYKQVTDKIYGLDLTTESDFDEALKKLDSAIDNITARKSLIGSAQNRLDSALEALTIQSENLSSANSIITDADIASEASNFTQQQILQQVSTSLLAQANQAPSIALSLV